MAYFSTFETRDKLILLYFLQVSGLKLSETDLLHVVLDNGWMNYFDFARVCTELVEGGMLAVEKRPQGNLYSLGPQGKEVLDHFAERLPLSLRRKIQDYADRHRVAIHRAAQHLASYEKRSDNDYRVRLAIMDREDVLLSMDVLAPTEEMAKTFVNRWEERGQEVFTQVIRILGEAMPAEIPSTPSENLQSHDEE